MEYYFATINVACLVLKTNIFQVTPSRTVILFDKRKDKEASAARAVVLSRSGALSVPLGTAKNVQGLVLVAGSACDTCREKPMGGIALGYA